MLQANSNSGYKLLVFLAMNAGRLENDFTNGISSIPLALDTMERTWLWRNKSTRVFAYGQPFMTQTYHSLWYGVEAQ